MRGLVGMRTRGWHPGSRLFVLGERTGWSVDQDASVIASTARRLGYVVAPGTWASYASHQAVFLTSHFDAVRDEWQSSTHRLGTAYLHGRPGTPGYPEFDVAFECLRARPDRFDRVQVSCRSMEELALETGIDAAKVFRIPIGVDVELFALRTAPDSIAAREELRLPETAFVVGSFQKDGVGWGDGLEPKTIKGPDVLLDVVARVRTVVPELFVLLTGPARGYVRRGLERLGVAYRDLGVIDPPGIARAYAALDVYLVTSREEGGPKAVLESMASGVPLVTTRVGQAADIVRDAENGRILDVGDVEGLADAVAGVASASDGELEPVISSGRSTAEGLSHEELAPRWEALLDGFVERPGREGE
jgi:glycosyltransferase involved in cell wall biosynthesis